MTRIGNFFKKIGRGIKKGVKAEYNAGKKAVKFVREKAAPVVSKVAGVVGKVARFIPHPIAQAVATGANVVKKGADVVSSDSGG